MLVLILNEFMGEYYTVKCTCDRNKGHCNNWVTYFNPTFTLHYLQSKYLGHRTILKIAISNYTQAQFHFSLSAKP